MRRKAVIVGTIVTLVVSGLLGLLWSQQRRLIYFPSGGPVPPAAAVLPGARDVVLHTADGLELGAWYLPGTGGPAVLVLPGNGGDRSMRAPLAAGLHRMGLSVLLVDYRGYGGNPGKPTEEGLATDARAAHDWLTAQPEVDRVVYFGESLGAAVAVGLAIERPPAALTPGMYSAGNHMLLARLLRSIVRSSFDEVDPSVVNATPCLPTFSAKASLACHSTYVSVSLL